MADQGWGTWQDVGGSPTVAAQSPTPTSPTGPTQEPLTLDKLRAMMNLPGKATKSLDDLVAYLLNNKALSSAARFKKGDVAGGSADALEMGMQAAAPLSLGAASIPRLLAGAATGYGTSKGTEAVGNMFGVDPGKSQLTGDILGALLGSTIGAGQGKPSISKSDLDPSKTILGDVATTTLQKLIPIQYRLPFRIAARLWSRSGDKPDAMAAALNPKPEVPAASATVTPPVPVTPKPVTPKPAALNPAELPASGMPQKLPPKGIPPMTAASAQDQLNNWLNPPIGKIPETPVPQIRTRIPKGQKGAGQFKKEMEPNIPSGTLELIQRLLGKQ